MTDREKLEICLDALLQIKALQPRPKRNGDYDLHDIQAPKFLALGAIKKIVGEQG